VNPAVFGQTNNYITSSDTYGDQFPCSTASTSTPTPASAATSVQGGLN
jgi:hypothetical protein